MSVSTRIWLPNHATNGRILKVLGRCLGWPMPQAPNRSSNQTATIDGSLPCSDGNPWVRNLPPGFGYREATKSDKEMSAGFGHLVLRCGPTPDHIEWFCTREPEDEEAGVLLKPDSTAMAVAMGRRLVGFFGGSLVADDATSPSTPWCVDDVRALFPQKKEGQSSDDRWYAFNNALESVAVLSLDEVRVEVEVSAYGLPGEGRSAERWWMMDQAVGPAQTPEVRRPRL